MHHADYWREEAMRYRQQAESAGDPAQRKELLECAEICEDYANYVDTLRASG